MNIAQLEKLNLSIIDYLAWRGIHPVKSSGDSLFFLSPIRSSDTSPSFSVSRSKNLWADHGELGRDGQKCLGGTLLDLAKLLCGSTSAALNELTKFSGEPAAELKYTTVSTPTTDAIEITTVRLIQHKAIIDYLTKIRKIKLAVARIYCREIWYTNKGREWNYFAIGFRNYSGGWELRGANEKGFKGSTSPKDIAWIRTGSKRCCVFEGFMDFLSFLSSVGEKKINSDFVVLNSVAMVARAIPPLANYTSIDLYLDNDNGGNTATSRIIASFPFAKDHRAAYSGFKDVNEYWISRVN